MYRLLRDAIEVNVMGKANRSWGPHNRQCGIIPKRAESQMWPLRVECHGPKRLSWTKMKQNVSPRAPDVEVRRPDMWILVKQQPQRKKKRHCKPWRNGSDVLASRKGLTVA